MSSLATLQDLIVVFLPRELYRVEHAGSQAHFNKNGALVLQFTINEIDDRAMLEEAVIKHLNWSSRADSRSCLYSQIGSAYLRRLKNP